MNLQFFNVPLLPDHAIAPPLPVKLKFRKVIFSIKTLSPVTSKWRFFPFASNVTLPSLVMVMPFLFKTIVLEGVPTPFWINKI